MRTIFTSFIILNNINIYKTLTQTMSRLLSTSPPLPEGNTYDLSEVVVI
jgi:hypothetical protein